MCRDLFLGALKQGIDCPIRVVPFCHPKERIEVFIDGKKGIVTLCCGRCDQVVGVIYVKKYDTRQTERAIGQTRRKGKKH